MHDLFTVFVIQSILWFILFIFLFRFVSINSDLKKQIADIIKKSVRN